MPDLQHHEPRGFAGGIGRAYGWRDMGGDVPIGMSFQELLSRARAGDGRAREELFKQYQSRLDSWASRRLSRARPGLPRPSDIAQDTAESALKAFSSFHGNTEAEWRTWLQRIFRNEVAQSIRAARAQKRDVLALVPLEAPEAQEARTPQMSPSQAISQQEDWRWLLTRIYQLPDAQRDAIWLCHLKELPVAEAARRLGKTEAAVAGLLQRGLKTLRTLEPEEQLLEEGRQNEPSMVLSSAASALLTYLRRRDAGEVLDVATFSEAYPDCANELREMLRWMERLQALRPTSSSKP